MRVRRIVKGFLFKTSPKHFCPDSCVSEVFHVVVLNYGKTFGALINENVRDSELHLNIPKFAILNTLLSRFPTKVVSEKWWIRTIMKIIWKLRHLKFCFTQVNTNVSRCQFDLSVTKTNRVERLHYLISLTTLHRLGRIASRIENCFPFTFWFSHVQGCSARCWWQWTTLVQATHNSRLEYETNTCYS